MKRLKPKVYAARAEYLDPSDCGSMIAYRIHGRRYLSSEIDLADCNRKISWYFYSESQALNKIDKAIEVLTSFRVAFVNAKKQFAKTKKKRRKPRIK